MIRAVQVDEAIRRIGRELLDHQSEDGAWRYCFENGILTDAYMIILYRTLEIHDDAYIRALHNRILSLQEDNGTWKWYRDEEDGNLSLTAEAYFALLYSGFSHETDGHMQKAKQWMISKGGLHEVQSVLTKVIFACTGQLPWPHSLQVPIEILLLPDSFPIHFHDFAGFARVHLAPILVMADRRFSVKTGTTPDLSGLILRTGPGMKRPDSDNKKASIIQQLIEKIKESAQTIASLPEEVHRMALQRAELYMLERIEPDGTLYSYANSTFLMVYALLALGYGKRHPTVMKAVRGLKSLSCMIDGLPHVQNSPSTVWDSALISYVLQEAGFTAKEAAIRKAGDYLLSRQHRKLGDWSAKVRHPVPGGWGFSDSNTMNPDVDDTTAALRAISSLAKTDRLFRDAADRGLNWVLSAQNDDGGWPAFEKNTDKQILTWIPVNGAEFAAIDPSTADLTGRTLEYLGKTTGFTAAHPFILRAVQWLKRNQEENGSWYGRWGICYLYGTWAAVTGMVSVGVGAEDPSVRKAVQWVKSVQNPDGGWGESCSSDRLMRFVPLPESTPSQTAWALDSLIAAGDRPSPEIERGIHALLHSLNKNDWTASYPTGAGLPGQFYNRYHSYNLIWPLAALSHYRSKYGNP